MGNITLKIDNLEVLRIESAWEHAYHRGREVAENQANEPYFDVDVAISSFDYDPPDSAFQRGYLRGLINCNNS